MNAQYRHSQPGHLMVIIGIILLISAGIVFIFAPRPVSIVIGSILTITALLVFNFYKLTTEIKEGFFGFWFGLGIFSKNIPLDQIAYCEPYKGVIFGWGIHYGPGGWLYNVSGMKAVTVALKSGRKLFIGTDEPVELIEAINSAIGRKDGDEISGMWTEVKADYLKRVEEALSAARHPQSFEILAEVGNHLDRRLMELGPQQRNWENFQRIITEMGPPSEYAEFIGEKINVPAEKISGKFVITLALVLSLLAAGMVILPIFLQKNKNAPQDGEAKKFINEPEVNSVTVAIESAKIWLKLVDEGAYGRSWEQAAEFFKKNVSREQWITALDGARKPLGKTLSRKVMTYTYTTKVPGGPDGQYVIIQFETSFENKANAVETVTPMMDSDGRWRVSGYYIR